jgi:hypothetical protein
MELQSIIGTSCASPEWIIHIIPDTTSSFFVVLQQVYPQFSILRFY